MAAQSPPRRTGRKGLLADAAVSGFAVAVWTRSDGSEQHRHRALRVLCASACSAFGVFYGRDLNAKGAKDCSLFTTSTQIGRRVMCVH